MFGDGSDFGTGAGPHSVCSIDLGGDGDHDLGTPNFSTNNVSILLNNGDATFQAPVDYGAGEGPYSVFSIDLDGVGSNDLGNFDSVIVEFRHEPNVAAGDSLVAADLIIAVGQAVPGAAVGMAWDFDGFVMDSVVWTSQAETAFSMRLSWVRNNIDSTNSRKQFQFIGQTIDANCWLARGVVGTYWGHVTSWADGDTLCISQNSWVQTMFLDSNFNEYVPIWGGDATLIAHELSECEGQDPDDPGRCDRVCVSFTHVPDVEIGDSVVVLVVHFDVRDDVVRSVSTGYGWSFDGLEMDSANWTPQGNATFPGFPLVWSQSNLDSTNFYNRFQVTGFGFGVADLVTSADICTFYGHVNTWGQGDTIIITPNSFIPMAFVTSVNVEFVPVWGGDIEFWHVATDVRIIDSETIPTQFELSHNYPNPFNPSTTICFRLPIASHTDLSIYNILGQQITTLVDEYLPAGEYRVTWDGQNAPSGVYLYKLRADKYTESRKMVLLK
jgi:hypothetical protein